MCVISDLSDMSFDRCKDHFVFGSISCQYLYITCEKKRDASVPMSLYAHVN